MIHSKIIKKSDVNAPYSRKFHLRPCTPITLSSCDLQKPIRICRVADQNFSVSSVFITFVVDFRLYHAFLSLLLLIFECIKCVHHLFWWFSSVSSVSITCFVDFRLYYAFLSFFLLIFECIMRFYHCFWWFSSVSCVSITFCRSHQTSDGKAWYTRKSTTKVIKPHDTLENQ